MTLLRSWTEAWLKYVRWYYATALSPDVSIEDFIQAPVVTTRWKASNEFPLLTRFGLMWKLFDEVTSYRHSEPILAIDRGNGRGATLLGGISGSEFLVYASGLNQPRAGYGSIPSPLRHNSLRLIPKLRSIT